MRHQRGQRSRRAWERLLPLAAAFTVMAALFSVVADAQESAPEPAATPQAPPADLPPVPDPPRFVSGLVENFENVTGDIFFWGQSGTLSGTIGDNAFLGGQGVVVAPGTTLGGDLFAFAGDVAIDGEILSDAYIWAGTARIGRDAVIHGNVLCFCGTLRVDGTVRGQIRGGGGNTAISGDVGSVKVEAGILTVGPDAIIRGDLEYEANDEADIAESATIMGEVRRQIKSDGDAAEDAEASGGPSAWSVGWKLWGYLSKLLVGVAFLLIGGRTARLPAQRLRDAPAAGLGFGFVVAVVVPVGCVVAIGLIVSLPLGVIGLVLFALAVFLSSLVTSQFLGDWLMRRATGSAAPSEYAALAVGLLLLTLLGLVPYLGFLIRLTAWILGLGGMFLALRPVVAGGSAMPGAEAASAS